MLKITQDKIGLYFNSQINSDLCLVGDFKVKCGINWESSLSSIHGRIHGIKGINWGQVCVRFTSKFTVKNEINWDQVCLQFTDEFTASNGIDWDQVCLQFTDEFTVKNGTNWGQVYLQFTMKSRKKCVSVQKLQLIVSWIFNLLLSKHKCKH